MWAKFFWLKTVGINCTVMNKESPNVQTKHDKILIPIKRTLYKILFEELSN